MKLTKEQQEAVSALVDGVNSKRLIQSLGGYAGTGKSQPLDSTIVTPGGFVQMGDVKVGDEVCTPSGNIATIDGVFPQGKLNVYKLIFWDGSFVEASGEHIWRVYDRSRQNKVYHCTTEYMKEKANLVGGNKRFHIVTPSCVYFKKQPISIDPYLLGILLGDGYFGATTKLTSCDEEIIDHVSAEVNKMSLALIHKQRYDYAIKSIDFVPYKRNPLTDCIKQYNLYKKTAKYKHVPTEYIFNSKETRLSLLQGLMDTDGTVDKRTGMPYYSTVSQQLALDVKCIIESLGGICKISNKKGKYNGRIHNSYLCSIRYNKTSDLFRLRRKKKYAKDRIRKTQRSVKKIEFFRQAVCQCISLAGDEKLYLTDNCVPTHNTTVVKHLIEKLPSFAVASYTGKAANVLRNKGVLHASTIHSLIYKPVITHSGGVEFVLNNDMPYNGIIIDEASMVSKEIYTDLQFFGVPLIFVGDHGQLPPVSESTFNIMENPDMKLETVHRNAGDIAKFAEHIRMGNHPRQFEFSEKINFIFNKYDDRLDRVLMQSDQVICAYNKTRVEVNEKIRRLLGYEGILVPGERIMCLRNHKGAGLFNGMQGTVIKAIRRRGVLRVDFESNGLIYSDIPVDEMQFGKEKPEFEHDPEHPHPFEYAYCVTCHKAQGDEWENVLVFEQRCKNWDHRRWAYTAASRTKGELWWVLGA